MLKITTSKSQQKRYCVPEIEVHEVIVGRLLSDGTDPSIGGGAYDPKNPPIDEALESKPSDNYWDWDDENLHQRNVWSEW